MPINGPPLERFHQRPLSHLGSLAAEFNVLVGDPGWPNESRPTQGQKKMEEKKAPAHVRFSIDDDIYVLSEVYATNPFQDSRTWTSIALLLNYPSIKENDGNRSPSRIGISGNEAVDRLAAAAHHLDAPIITVPKIHEPKLLIHQAISRQYPDSSVAEGRPPARVSPNLRRSSASLLYRLRTGCAFTASALHRLDSSININCPTCSVSEDFDHLLSDCPTLADQRKFLLNDLQHAGAARTTTPNIIFPPGLAGAASKTFAAFRTSLEDTGLFDRNKV
ncbi:hypothetical protein HPB47_019600 [Ixodes persulcatus]|uniref:Uncharacterized protein n=1 Tax=Ixodes persulcatus TaxID=34615 RepID=A0AC60QHR5_IXOPE|nr:hypothetical protein HPB47_019600 [Ixodes persulcatus]